MREGTAAIILSIGIPVYNGADFIVDAIKSINIPDEFRDTVEILVCDNCSTDNTAEVVRKFPNVKYFKNEANIGYDRNLNEIFNHATGKYVWPLAADDMMLHDFSGILTVMDIVNTEPDVAVIHVGGNLEIDTTYKVFKNEDFFIATNFQSGGVSSNIISKDLWIKSNPEVFFDSEWIHFGVIVKIIRLNKSVVTSTQFIDENPLARNKRKAWSNNGRSLVVMLKLVTIINSMKKYGYSKKFLHRAKYIIKSDYPASIIKSKAEGLIITSTLVKNFITCYKEHISFWLVDLPFLLAPRALCKFIYKNRSFLKKNESI